MPPVPSHLPSGRRQDQCRRKRYHHYGRTYAGTYGRCIGDVPLIRYIRRDLGICGGCGIIGLHHIPVGICVRMHVRHELADIALGPKKHGGFACGRFVVVDVPIQEIFLTIYG